MDFCGPIKFTHKYETVWNRHFHWLIFFFKTPGWAFSCFARKTSSSLGGQRGGRNGCCAVSAAQITVCALTKCLLYFSLVPCFFSVFVSFFFDKFTYFWDMCFFLLLFSAFLGCCFRRVFSFFSPVPPRSTCCLTIRYAMHRCFCFYSAFFLALWFFSAIIMCCCFAVCVACVLWPRCVSWFRGFLSLSALLFLPVS